ncbi:glycosyltransferase family 4 protein [Thomasclavelia sp.]|uniref:glycosyltransferase family 4 protein n=1 Tax=Thomasclavelia sp. TaxID=3025757 RepID=UPI0025D70A1A|nr:glycosyltransferase family 4 protein [Thomasclavelia sp.]
MICVVSVIDSISVTSMPVNEFIIYRDKHKFNIKQKIIVCDTTIPQEINIPNNVEIYLVGKNIFEIRSAVKIINNQCQKKHDTVIYHLHHQKSAMLFFLATVYLKVKQYTLYTIHSTYKDRNFKYKITSCLCSLISNYVNCVSLSSFEVYNNTIKRIKGSKFLYIQNGVDVLRIESIINNQSVKRKKKSLVYIGRMIPIKNHSFLIKLMKKLPDYEMIFIGQEDEKQYIRTLAKEEGVIDRIKFTGLISRESVFCKLSESLIYVSPSLVEGMPISVLEAMYVGLVPILSDIEPHKEIARKCQEIRIRPLNLDVWANTIKEISDINNENLDIEISKIRSSIYDQFSLDAMHQDYLEIYNKILKNKE